MTTATINYRSAPHRAAHDAAAAQAGVTVSEWLRTVWDHYSGGERAQVLPFAAPVPLDGEWSKLVVRLSEDADQRHRDAAAAASLPLGTWRLVVADVAAGVSDLGVQLRR